MKGFSIIIVTWNALEHLKNFLPSVILTDYPDFEIIIADNASDDGSKEWIKSTYPDIKIASFDRNYGYCGGNNRGVPFAEKEILLFLNNDVKVEKNWLHDLNRVFSEGNVAAAQPKMRSFENPEFFEYAGAAGGFMDKYGYTFCRGRIFDKVEKDHGQYDNQPDLFWASGAALAIRKDLFIKSGRFDEDFEFHMEEIDLCWRLQNQGYKISYAPQSVVYHLGGGSLPMGSPRKVYYNFRNSLFMLWKNYSASSLQKRFMIRLFLDVIAAWKALLTGNPKEWLAVFKAHVHFFFSLGSMNKKRRQLQKLRTNPDDPETMLNISVIWKYFFKGTKSFTDLKN
ncbi:MAG: glycosyltransferase family 2 protein [Gracilimonas sp.]|uniref:glycosyltransferase family 2 protein n=1 Tax=Gracilimonas sp. TaxID=1974203 RepID=UPI0019940F0C|nr:glycosyltransferase family 2 protein [Gracilimonas sp.]MBD3615864.1 glycosyltransferase family 2 protein [Gracilimonas sp.]